MRWSAMLVCLLGAGIWPGMQSQAQEPVAPMPAASTVALTAPSDAPNGRDSAAAKPNTLTSKEKAAVESALRIEGEARFRTNCGRCHMAPHKFPPRVMATAIRHMRVRATLTDEDMRLILRYMTQ